MWKIWLQQMHNDSDHIHIQIDPHLIQLILSCNDLRTIAIQFKTATACRIWLWHTLAADQRQRWKISRDAIIKLNMIPLPAPFAFRVLQFPASSCAPQLNLSITWAPSFYFSVNISGRWPGLFSSAFFLRLPSKVLLQVLARASPKISHSKCENHRTIGSELLVSNWHELAWTWSWLKSLKSWHRIF